MRVRLTGGDVFEVKRTHISDTVSEIGEQFVGVVSAKLKKPAEDIKDKAIMTLKLVDGDFNEVDILSDSKKQLLEILDKLVHDGYYDAREEMTVVITNKDLESIFNNTP